MNFNFQRLEHIDITKNHKWDINVVQIYIPVIKLTTRPTTTVVRTARELFHMYDIVYSLCMPLGIKDNH